MKLKLLKEDFTLQPFDCGDADLNGFLVDDAKAFYAKRIGKTFLILDNENIVAYFCLLNDKITKIEASNSAWKRVKKLFPQGKHFCSYPAVKIGRFAVAKNYRHLGIGSKIMDMVKYVLYTEVSHSYFRFLTVDAYISAIPFYEKNCFKFLDAEDKNKHTRLMYYDMLEM